MSSTHPRTLDRVRRAAQEAGNSTPRNPIVGRDVYLEKVRGLIYGDSPDQGFVRGQDFLHPKMRFRFRVPAGFKMINRPNQVLATGPGDAIILFSAARRAGQRAPLDYLVNVWARGVRLAERERLTINGLDAARAMVRVRTQRGSLMLSTVAIRKGAQMFQFLFLEGNEKARPIAALTRETAQTFQEVTANEAARWQPYRIRLRRVRPGDTVRNLATLMAVDRLKAEHFRVINGLGPGQEPKPGSTVKIITDGRFSS